MTWKHPVHLVGSIGLANEDAVFEALAARLGDKASRYPDGETGARTNWIAWLGAVFANHPAFIRTNADEAAARPAFGLAEPAAAADVTIDSLGYAAPAIQSYASFKALKAEGRIPIGTRFQVSLPTAIAPTTAFITAEQQPLIEPLVEFALQADLDRILAAIPPSELAIQWDVAHEIIAHDGGWTLHYSDTLDGSIERICRQLSYVPLAAEAGIHLCYGDPGHKHIVEPADLSTCVQFANAICAHSERPVSWVHMPVPRERDDEAYFSPLRSLKLNPQTELYLGLVHYTDGLEGSRRRLETASNFVSTFGISTECGFGRRPGETIPGLLDIHVQLADGR